MDSSLVLVANAKDGTISTFTLTDDALEPLGRSDVGALGMPLAVDADRDLVFAGTNNPRGVTVLRLDRASGALTPLGRYPTQGSPTYLALNSHGGLLLSASYHQGLGEVFQVGVDGIADEIARRGGGFFRSVTHGMILDSRSRLF